MRRLGNQMSPKTPNFPKTEGEEIKSQIAELYKKIKKKTDQK